MKTLKLLFLLAGISLVAFSCDKTRLPDPQPGTEGATPYYVRMTDAPGPYLAVNIDLKAVEVTGSGSTIMLNTAPGIYNLLDFSNGNDTLIATGSLNIQAVEQIRLILGENNSIVTSDGVSHELKTPSAQQSGLKLQVHHTLQAGVAYQVLLDFDAAKSIVEQGNGGYSLKPVIRTIEKALSGSIKGKLSQPGVFAIVTATSGSQSYSTFVKANGEFILSGLPPGTYTLSVTPAPPYNSASLNNITVITGTSTDVGTIAI